jgi:hypothetical protein
MLGEFTSNIIIQMMWEKKKKKKVQLNEKE